MDTVSFLSHKELAKYIYKYAFDGKEVVVALFYDDATQLVKELLCFDDTHIVNIELEDPGWGGYDKEFYITIGDDLGIYVQKAWHENNEYHKEGYYKFGSDVTLISGDANSSIINACEEDCYFAEFEIGEFEKDEEHPIEFENIDDFLDFVEYIINHLFE